MSDVGKSERPIPGGWTDSRPSGPEDQAILDKDAHITQRIGRGQDVEADTLSRILLAARIRTSVAGDGLDILLCQNSIVSGLTLKSVKEEFQRRIDSLLPISKFLALLVRTQIVGGTKYLFLGREDSASMRTPGTTPLPKKGNFQKKKQRSRSRRRRRKTERSWRLAKLSPQQVMWRKIPDLDWGDNGVQ
ncbi:uncharacterized protein LOC143981667 isoform X1 [Lithobates pipiens]